MKNPREGVKRAREAVSDGRAHRLLDDLVTATNDLSNTSLDSTAEGQL